MQDVNNGHMRFAAAVFQPEQRLLKPCHVTQRPVGHVHERLLHINDEQGDFLGG
jgi:hypothetical protein